MKWFVLLALTVFLPFTAAAGPGEKTDRKAPELDFEILSGHEILCTWEEYPGELYLERRLRDEDYFRVIAAIPPGRTEYRDAQLEPYREYVYRLRDTRSDQLEEFGTPGLVTIDIPAPDSLHMERVGIDSILVSIDKVDPFWGDVVLQQTIGGWYRDIRTVSTSREVAIGRVKAEKIHDFRAFYQGTRNRGHASERMRVHLSFPAPKNVRFQALNDHSAEIRWTNPLPYPCRVEIEKAEGANVDTIRVASMDSLWVDTDIEYSRLTFYRVRFVHNESVSRFSESISIKLEIMPIQDLEIDPVQDLFARLSWTDYAPIGEHYQVLRSMNEGDFVPVAEVPIDSTSFVDTLLARGEHIAYQIVTVGSDGKEVKSAVVEQFIPKLDQGMCFCTSPSPDDSASNAEAFHIDRYEVLVEEYVEFCEDTDREFPRDPGFQGYPYFWRMADRFPAVNVSWKEAVAFCNWRSARRGLEPAYDEDGNLIEGSNGYRLINRRVFTSLVLADTTMKYQANFGGDWDQYALPLLAGEEQTPHSTPANLLGNVWEWVEDNSPTGGRMILGGSFATPADLAGPLPQYSYPERWASPRIGFRTMLPATSPAEIQSAQGDMEDSDLNTGPTTAAEEGTDPHESLESIPEELSVGEAPSQQNVRQGQVIDQPDSEPEQP
ncbi:SUMF1/EgtB/PvdO family nonheme iron enzyme [bacterium]|nr:SUMF1/EgtB/PvdO family nonheme iron enzyme [bacterium]